MKKRVPDDRPSTRTIDVCDRCGGESLQDDVLRMDHIPIIGDVLFHSNCSRQTLSAVRKSFGLKESEVV